MPFKKKCFEPEQLESSRSTLYTLNQPLGLWFWHQFDAKRPVRPTNPRWPPSTSWKVNFWSRAPTLRYKYTFFSLNQPQGFQFWHYVYGLILVWPYYQDGCHSLKCSNKITYMYYNLCFIKWRHLKHVIENLLCVHFLALTI